MGISFTTPWWWLAWPGLVLAVCCLRRPWLKAARRNGRQALKRERRRLLLRLLLVTLLTAVLTGPRLLTTVRQQAVIFAVDSSASVGLQLHAGEEWVRQALGRMGPGDAAGVVAFGRRALVEEPVAEEVSFRQVQSDPDITATSTGEALRLSRALLPGGARRRVVLLTDGRDTGGDAVLAARQLQQEGIRVDVVPLGREGLADVRLETLEVPPRARVGEMTSIQARIISPGYVTASLFLQRDGELLDSPEAALQPGENSITLPVEVGAAGMRRYRLSLAVSGRQQDEFPANNELGALQQVIGPPRVLVVAQEPGEARPLVASLEASGGVEARVVGTDSLPADLAGWAGYQAVFLVNVPAHALGEKSMAEIETYVRDGGGGLIMAGGPDSFGPGGYAGTPVERALPVEMRVSGRGEMPSLGLVLVIDKSGSMSENAGGGEKMALAREAAVRSIDLLTYRDQVGVLVFDSQPWWLVPLTALGDKEEVKERVGRLAAGGGTEIYPALAGAYQALRDSQAQVKHVILLTDGISASGGPYLELLDNMRGAGITLSSVAVGAGADAGMLQALAELGRGRFYATTDAASIPSIFTKETVMATRSFAVNEKFFPRVAAGSELIQGISGIPALEGYITVTPKDRAQTVLISQRGDPILAAWQYGLGRAVVWTPDVAGRWSAPWINSPVFPRMWGNILSWTLPSVEASVLQVQGEVAPAPGGAGGRVIRIRVDDSGGWNEVRQLQAVVTGPDGTASRVPLAPAGPGRYTASIAATTGAHVIGVTTAAGGGEGRLLAQTGLVVPYPQEFRQAGLDREALAAIARAGGGEVLRDPSLAFAPNLPPVRASRDVSLILLAVAAVLWVLDIAGRRLVLAREERELLQQAIRRALAVLSPVRGRSGGGPAPSQAWTGRTVAAVQELRALRVPVKRGEEALSLLPESPPAPEENQEQPPGADLQAGGGRLETPVFPEPEAANTATRLLAAKRRRETS